MLQPLLDRIEIIPINAYLPTERVEIAQKYLIPDMHEEYGFRQAKEEIEITDAALAKVIQNYCNYEAGVRNLRKNIDRVFRKIAWKIENKKALEVQDESDSFEESEEMSGPTEVAFIPGFENINDDAPEIIYQVNTQNLDVFIDDQHVDELYYEGLNRGLPIGCSNGLAYMTDGAGAIMKIQIVRKFKPLVKDDGKDKDSDDSSPALGDIKITATGSLGDVMKESLSVVKIASLVFLLGKGEFTKEEVEKLPNLHLHVPMGSTPKDGPSAGVSLFAAVCSALTNKPLRSNIAMTGEISTLGEVISIGGVQEKLTACKNHGVTNVILPIGNKKHVEKLPEEFKKGFKIYYAKTVHDVYSICFEDGAKSGMVDYEVDEFEDDEQ